MSTESPISDLQSQLDQQKRRYEATKKRVLSPQSGLHDLRNCFQRSLNKLLNLATRDVAVKECRNIIEHNLNLEALKVFLSCLADHKKNKSPGSREQEVGLIGYTAKAFSEKLLADTTMKLTSRIAELVRAYFKDLNRSVHEAAAAALCEVYIYAVPKQNAEGVVRFMFDPLVSIMAAGVDVKAQLAGAVSVFAWVECLAETDETVLLTILSPKVIQLFLKLRPEFPDLISTIGILVDSCGFKSLLPDLFPLLSKLQAYVSVVGQHTQMMRIEACKLLRVIGRSLHSVVDLDLGGVTDEIIALLQEAKIDKLPAVQQAVRDALKEWEMLKALRAEQVRKSAEVQESKEVHPAIAEPSNFRALRELVKRKKSLRGEPEEKFSAQWGLSKAKYLEKGSGNYVSSLGHGKVDINRALNSRKSVRDYVKSRPMSAKVREPQIYSKAFEPAMSLPRSTLPEGDRPVEEDKEGIEQAYQQEEAFSQEEIKGQGADDYYFEESKSEHADMLSPPPLRKTGDKEVFTPIPESPESYDYPKHEKHDEPSHAAQVFVPQPESMLPFVPPQLKKRQHTPEDPEENQVPLENQAPLFEIEKSVGTENRMSRDLKHGLLKSGVKENGRLIMEDVGAKLAAIVRPKKLEVQKQKDLAVVENRRLRSVAMNVAEIPGKLHVAQLKSVGLDPHPKSVGTSVHLEEIKPVKKQVRFDSPVEQQRREYESHMQSIEQDRQLLNNLKEEFQFVVESLQEKVDEGFYAIESQLYNLDERIEDSNSRLYHLRLDRATLVEKKVEPKSQPVKPVAEISVQTVRDIEIQTEPTAPQSRELHSREVSEPPSKASSRQPEFEVDDLSRTWLSVLEKIEKAELEDAYSEVLGSSDDLYLLRLMHLTGSCMSSLTPQTGSEVLRHTAHILGSGFVNQLGAQWIAGSVKAGVFKSLSSETKRQLLTPLSRMEDQQSAQLYKYITKKY
mmetsp:Transcript_848/g.1967  ORF Transcript_848/g.1967 Transcript_848/m.1967 type:complete len:959 (-) Transcript_848:32-2908(-)